MDPEHHWLEIVALCVVRAGEIWCPDVEEEAVFGAGGSLKTDRAVV